MVSSATTPPNMQLGRLFKAAAGVTDAEGKGLGAKGLQIADALTDAAKKISLKPAEVDRLVSFVDKLPAAEKKAAIDCLDLFRDRFEIPDAAAKKKLLDFVPKTATPIEVGGRVRTVAAAKAEAVTPPLIASAKDINGADKAIDTASEAAGKLGPVVADEMGKVLDQTMKDGGVKPEPDAGRKAQVKTQAKRQARAAAAQETPAAAPPKDATTAPATDAAPRQSESNATMALFDQYAKSPFFEDRLMAALGKAGMKFMTDMNKRLASFDDPAREEEIRSTTKGNMKQMLDMANSISPGGKAKVAQQMADFLKANPEWKSADPQLQQWIDKVKATLPPDAADAKGGHDALLDSLPAADNDVILAMQHSDRPELREWAPVFQASELAEGIKQTMQGDTAKMSEEDCRGLLGKAQQFKAGLDTMKQMLPPDMQKQIGDVKLDQLPAAVDPTSRQVMFQQINLMMNQYQQIMQAFSEIINKLNEMAMDPIRKMGR